MAYCSYYLGDTFTSVVEGLEALEEERGDGSVTHEEFRCRADLLRAEISGQPEWLAEHVFRRLKEIAEGNEESLVIVTSRLVRHGISPEALDGYLTDFGCRGFMLLADSFNLAEYAVELAQLGWKAESFYRSGVFQGVAFEVAPV